MVITPWAGFIEILFNLANQVKHTIMKYFFLFFSITIIFFLSCSKNDDNHDIEDFSKDSGTFIDERDGHNYNWVKIGEQIWMAENLAWLPKIETSEGNPEENPFYYVYGFYGNNIVSAKATKEFLNYGVLYNWKAAIDACPKGWHLPSNNEWEKLAKFISNQKGPYEKMGQNWIGISKHLKATKGWNNYPNLPTGNSGNGTDDFGFKALPGGYCTINGYEYSDYPENNPNNEVSFYDAGSDGYWWSATEYSAKGSYSRFIGSNNDEVFHTHVGDKVSGFNIRCIKN